MEGIVAFKAESAAAGANHTSRVDKKKTDPSRSKSGDAGSEETPDKWFEPIWTQFRRPRTLKPEARATVMCQSEALAKPRHGLSVDVEEPSTADQFYI